MGFLYLKGQFHAKRGPKKDVAYALIKKKDKILMSLLRIFCLISYEGGY